MASRPIFLPASEPPYFLEVLVEFQWHPGFSISQKQKSVRSLHCAAMQQQICSQPLEISSKSELELGNRLSSFNLKVLLPSGKTTPVENLFQSSKVFEDGGPFTDLLVGVAPADAKRDPRLKEHGKLIGFKGKNGLWPTEPKTLFYDWIYMKALAQQQELRELLAPYSGFTDIEFNPKKSFSCQARSLAIWVGLGKAGLLHILDDETEFRRTLSQGRELTQRLL